MKIAYLGYDLLYPCLEALEGSGCEVLEVFTCATDQEFEFNDRVTAFARERGLPLHIEKITREDFRRLKASGCEAVFCAGYFHRVPTDHDLPIINVHPALLPIGRGAWPMPVWILRGMTEGGVTLHKMAADFDTGDILIQKAFSITEADDLETLTEKICQIGAELCAEVAGDLGRYLANARAQGEGEYWPCPQKEDATVTADTPPDVTRRIFRAFYGFDCYLRTDTTEICVVGGRFRPCVHEFPFGTETDGGIAVTGGMIVLEKPKNL